MQANRKMDIRELIRETKIKKKNEVKKWVQAGRHLKLWDIEPKKEIQTRELKRGGDRGGTVTNNIYTQLNIPPLLSYTLKPPSFHHMGSEFEI